MQASKFSECPSVGQTGCGVLGVNRRPWHEDSGHRNDQEEWGPEANVSAQHPFSPRDPWQALMKEAFQLSV